MDQLTSKDMEFIADSVFPNIDKEIVIKMVEFSNRVRMSWTGTQVKGEKTPE